MSTPDPTPSKLRTLLILGRTSNLPTVWSNCLAGWLIAGGGPIERFIILNIGATLLYIGGMFLNDAVDADWDSRHKNDRPIVKGHISQKEVWIWSMALLGIGAFFLIGLGKEVGAYGVLTLTFIVLYDVLHKGISWSPILMCLCRFFLILSAAATGTEGVNGLAVWTAVVMACYIAGLSYLARSESIPGVLKFWPIILLITPLVLAWIINDAGFKAPGLAFSVVLLGWVTWRLWFTYGQATPQIGKTISGLLAGIVLVDLLSVAGGTPILTAVFIALFGLALVLQRTIPAT